MLGAAIERAAPWRRFPLVLMIGLPIIGVLPSSTQAYENAVTHPRISLEGKLLLQEKYPGFHEIGQFVPEIEDGSRDEDVPDSAVLNHFYDPATQQALNVHVLGLPVPLANNTAIAQGTVRWQTAVNEYKAGRKALAYVYLGRAAHLFSQDLAQPGHVHNDLHVPHCNFQGFTGPILDLLICKLGPGEDRSPLEDFAERDATENPFLFPRGFQVMKGSPEFQAPEPLGMELAAATHNSSKFPGELDSSAGSGNINVAGNVVPAILRASNPSGPSTCFQLQHWAAFGDPDDEAKELCYNPDATNRYDGGTFNSWNNSFWKVPAGAQFSPLGLGSFYFDRYDLVKNGAGDTLNLAFFRLYIPQAINYTAGLYRLFGRTVDPIAPRVTLKENNSSGAVILPNGVTATTDIYIEGTDLTDGDHPVTSGIYRIILTRTSGGAYSSTAPFNGSTTESHVFEGLGEGRYVAQVQDGQNNETSVSFRRKGAQILDELA